MSLKFAELVKLMINPDPEVGAFRNQV